MLPGIDRDDLRIQRHKPEGQFRHRGRDQQHQQITGYSGDIVAETIQQRARQTEHGRTGQRDPLHEQGDQTEDAPGVMHQIGTRQHQHEGQQFGHDNHPENDADIAKTGQEKLLVRDGLCCFG